MDDAAKKTALRMIPYGLYALTCVNNEGQVAAATVNWVTQMSFEPPLIVIGVKADSGVHALLKETEHFALNVLGKDQQGAAFTFFKPLEREGDTIGGEAFKPGPEVGMPLILSCPAWIECHVEAAIEGADHTAFVGKVLGAGVRKEPEGRADDATLWLKELGEAVFYGG